MDWEKYFADVKARLNPGPPLIEQCKDVYRQYGYTVEKDFPGEYYYMFNPDTLQRVRLYYNGRVEEYR